MKRHIPITDCPDKGMCSSSILDLLQNKSENVRYDKNIFIEIVEETERRLEHRYIRFRQNAPYLICDPLFVFRGAPRTNYHDNLGYKNDPLTQRPKIIVLGNSQVHSLNCPPCETWPGIFEKISKIETYNASMGSFSLVQNFLTARELSLLKPDMLICVFYTGNNTINSLPTLRKSKFELKKMFSTYDDDVTRIFANPDVDPLVSSSREAKIVEFMKLSKLEKNHYVTAKINNIIHFLIPALRSNSQDFRDPFVDASFNVALEALSKIKQIAEKYTRLGLFLLVMPTKEFVLYNRALSCGDVMFSSEKQISILYETESEVIKRLVDYCNFSHIPTINPLCDLVNSMNFPIYNPLNNDGHPSRRGKFILAQCVKNYMAGRCLDGDPLTL